MVDLWAVIYSTNHLNYKQTSYNIINKESGGIGELQPCRGGRMQSRTAAKQLSTQTREEVQRSSQCASREVALSNEQLRADGAVTVYGGSGPAAMCFNKWVHTSCPCKQNISMCQTLSTQALAIT